MLVAAVLAGACGGEGKAERRRVLLVGIDGASPEVAFPMMEAGRLPHLAAIADAGIHGPLESVLPLYSPRIWNTIATGRHPEEHGIEAFVKKDDDGSRLLYLSPDRRVPALWNILSAHGVSVGIVNWWTTYPPEKVDGVMVSDHFFPEQIAQIKNTFQDESPTAGVLVHPPSWQPRAEALLDASGPAVETADPFAGNDALPHWVRREVLSRQYATDAQIVRVALGVIEEHDPDVMAVFMPGIDRVSHWLWGNLEPAEKYPETLRPTPSERAAGAEALRQYYAFTDELIGRLAAHYGPDDLVMVISDHGFEAHVSLMLLTGGHETPASLDGVVFARGRGVVPGAGSLDASVLDVAPSVLAWLGVPVSREMEGRPVRFLGLDDVPRTASYDDLPVERVTTAASGREADIVEHLRSLGYLEEPPQAHLEEPPQAHLEEPPQAGEGPPQAPGHPDAEAQAER